MVRPLHSPQFSSEPQAPHLILGAPHVHTHTGSLLLDVLQLSEEPPPQAGQELRVWPQGARESRTVRPAHVEPLLRLWVKQGQVITPTHPRVCTFNPDQALTSDLELLPASQQLCEPLPSLAESRAFAQQSLHRLSPAHRRLEQPALYEVRAGLRPQPSLCSLPPCHPHVSPLQVALSEKLQALVDRLSARGAL